MNNPNMNLKNKDEILEKIKILNSSYLKGWKPSNDDAGWAIAQIFSEMGADLNAALQRLPNKLFLSYLNDLGFTQSSPLPATVPITFTLTKNSKRSVVIPQQAEVATKDKVSYEIDNSFTVSSAKLEAFLCVDVNKNTVCDFSQEILDSQTMSLFSSEEQQQYLYFGDDGLFNVHRVNGDKNAYLEYIVPEIENKKWQYRGISEENKKERWIDFDGGRTRLNKENAHKTVKKKINGIDTYWIRIELAIPKKIQIEDFKIKYRSRSGIDALYYNDNPLDPRKTIYPFGFKPQNNDTFYIASSEAFSKKGSSCGIAMKNIKFTLDKKDNVRMETLTNAGSCSALEQTIIEVKKIINSSSSLDKLKNDISANISNTKHIYHGIVSFEYYNGSSWKKLIVQKDIESSNSEWNGVDVKFKIPMDFSKISVNGEEDFWIRVKLLDSAFGSYKFIHNKLVEDFHAPTIENIDIYVNAVPKKPQYIFRDAHNHYSNLLSADDTSPYSILEERNNSLYIGFDKVFDEGLISMLISLDERSEAPVATEWFVYANNHWESLPVKDGSNSFTKSGICSFVSPFNQMKVNQFGKDLYWLKIIFADNEQAFNLKGLHLNSVMATQCKTIENKILGSSNGSAFQVFTIKETPVLEMTLWVMESNIPHDTSFYEDKYNEGYWAEWQEVEDLHDIADNKRIYTFDSHSGEIHFGDSINAMIPPMLKDNIKVSYKIGGGTQGNVANKKITKLVNPLAYIDKIVNNESANGGANEQSIDSLISMAPKRIRHGYKAVTKDDFYALTKEASSNIAKVKTITNPGVVDLVIMPYSTEDHPVISPGLKKHLFDYISEKTSATVKINILNPDYMCIDVDMNVVIDDWSLASTLKSVINEKIREFLNPISGGVKQEGWGFGQVPKLSDIFNLMNEIEGILYIDKAEIFMEEKLLYDLDGESISKIDDDIMIYSGNHKINLMARSV